MHTGIPAKVVQKQVLTQNDNSQILQLFIEPETPFPYQAGDYLTLGFEPPADEEAAKDFSRFKPFSIANAPKAGVPLELHIRLPQPALDPWMEALTQLNLGDTVWINGPFKQYRLDKNLDTYTPIILVAGGTGFSPMKALLEQLLTQKAQNPISLYWGAKKPQELYLHDWMEQTAKQRANLHYIPVISEKESANEGGMRQGLVHQAVLEEHPSLAHARVYLCGPWEMVNKAKEDFINAGLPENAFN
jgi:CDP-4-dehydro-6-deoxyglucose reductase